MVITFELIQLKTCETTYYKINSLYERRQVADLVFFLKMTNGLIDAQDIQSCFEFVPTNLTLRRHRLLKTTRSTKKYVINGPQNRIATLVNSLHDQVDLYSGTFDNLITTIKNVLFTLCWGFSMLKIKNSVFHFFLSFIRIANSTNYNNI